jgi:hypothetical protein
MTARYFSERWAQAMRVSGWSRYSICLSLNFDLPLVMTKSLVFIYAIPFFRRLVMVELDILRAFDMAEIERIGLLMCQKSDGPKRNKITNSMRS